MFGTEVRGNSCCSICSIQGYATEGKDDVKEERWTSGAAAAAAACIHQHTTTVTHIRHTPCRPNDGNDRARVCVHLSVRPCVMATLLLTGRVNSRRGAPFSAVLFLIVITGQFRWVTVSNMDLHTSIPCRRQNSSVRRSTIALSVDVWENKVISLRKQHTVSLLLQANE